MRFAIALVIAFACSTVLAADPAQRTLSFEDRVKAQAAIERVYYSHQLGATKAFDDAMPKSVLEAKVRKYLEQTAALNVYWKTAVTDEMLQRELARMAQGSQMPERLRELYVALGNDPFIIKECLARAILVDRLTHNFYAFDSALHGKAREQAEQLHRRLASGELSPSVGHANRSVHELVAGATDASAPRSETPHQTRLTPEEFQKRRAELPTHAGEVSDVEESRDAFTFAVVLSETTTDVRVASYVVPKTSWDDWWVGAHSTLRAASIAAVASDRDSSIRPISPRSVPAQTSSDTPCTPEDTWYNGSLYGAPDARAGHTAIWTGSVMVVWGGSGEPGADTGGRYDPATDTWSPTSTTGAPAARYGHTAVWTGSQMVVWGGEVGSFPYALVNTGGRYDPVTDSWRPTSTKDAPTPRYRHTAVWTGSLMVVWGGDSNSGGRYDPVSDTWAPTSTTDAPSARHSHTAVWTGSLMVVWGGEVGIGPAVYDGGRYDPGTDSWTPMSTTGSPDECENTRHAVWTGNLVVLWCTSFHLSEVVTSGARYDPLADIWTPMSTVGGYGARYASSAVWTGSEMVIWGGEGRSGRARNEGARYDPVQNTWTGMASNSAARQSHSAIWTGTLMVVWGGYTGPRNPRELNTGGRYDPATDSWTPTSTDPPNAPAARDLHTATWTGNLMVVWGGWGNTDPAWLTSGGRYDPATDSWASTSITDAPAARVSHTAVWSGSEMLVWGGYAGYYDGAYHYLDTGGRYDPMLDRWTPMSTAGAPSARRNHTSIWTGSVMVAWGGYADANLNSGGRYDPATDTWSPTSADPASTPSPRYNHTAVWTGNLMVVWGGDFDQPRNSGGRYDPIADTWTPTSIFNAPAARVSHTAVWTGSRMLVWGGYGADHSNLVTGGMYDLADDSWTPTTTTNAPNPRIGPTAVWTGSVMVVWGGLSERTGGRYDPASDSWTPTSVDGAPRPRDGHTAIWTGSEMIVWGGFGDHRRLGNGGKYLVVTSPAVDRDCDGLSASEGDCDDTHATVYPAAPQICDGLNNDCNDPAWPAVPSNEANSDGDFVLLCAGDCDDTRAWVHPGATESCDGIDENCDGLIDNGGDVLCNDFNVCTDDACHGATGCSNVPNGDACDDEDPCTSGDICNNFYCSGAPASGIPCNDFSECTTGDTCSGGSCTATFVDCSDGNICTNDYCDEGVGCVYEPNEFPCDDGNPCTAGDTCAAGACRGISSDPKPKSSGYYKTLCERREHNQLPYQGDQLTDADAVCVGELTSTFAGISTIDDICAVIYQADRGGRHPGGPGTGPNSEECAKAEDELIATALNICRGRVCEEQSLDSRCNGNAQTTVGRSLADADAILDDAARTQDACRRAACELREINDGQALAMNSLLLALEQRNVRLTWSSPVSDDGSGATASYEIWRRAMGSNDAFVKIGTTAGLTFLDTTAGKTSWEYDITTVMSGNEGS